MSKDEARNLLKNADLTEKSGTLEHIMNLFPDIKLAKETVMFGDARTEKHKFPQHK